MELSPQAASHQVQSGDEKHFHAQIHTLSTHPHNHFLKMTISHTFKNSKLLKQNVALAALSLFLGGKGWLSLGPGFFLTFDASNCKKKIAR